MEKQIIELLRRIKNLEARLGITDTVEQDTAGGAAHNILSATHSDATVSAVTQGDIIVGNATPAWDDLAIGKAQEFLNVNAAGTDPVWKAFDWDDAGSAGGADMVHDHSTNAEGGTLAYGDVTGPAGGTADDIAVFNGATGKIIKDGGATIASLNTATQTHAAANKATPVDADQIPLADSAAAWVLKNITWLNIKTTLATYFGGLYFKLDQTVAQTTNKATPVDADAVPLLDSLAISTLKNTTWLNIKTTLKAYFDTLYSSATHNLLSITHPDTVAGSPVQGDIVVGNATPKWTKLARGTAYQNATMNAGATDPSWQSFNWTNQAAGAGASMSHAHTSAAEGGVLAQDVVKISKLVASDGAPDPALSADAVGVLTSVDGLVLVPATTANGLLIQGATAGVTQAGIRLTTTLTGTTANFGLNFSPIQTSIAANGFLGISAAPSFNATAGGPQISIYGILGLPNVKATASQNVTNFSGGYFRVDNLSTAGSIVTNAYAVDIGNPVATGAITNAYGIHIAAITTGGTLNYAIYVDGSLSRFSGVLIAGDDGGLASTVGLTNIVSGVGAGIGVVLMNGATARNSTGWWKIYNGTAARYVPFWTTITG